MWWMILRIWWLIPRTAWKLEENQHIYSCPFWRHIYIHVRFGGTPFEKSTSRPCRNNTYPLHKDLYPLHLNSLLYRRMVIVHRQMGTNLYAWDMVLTTQYRIFTSVFHRILDFKNGAGFLSKPLFFEYYAVGFICRPSTTYPEGLSSLQRIKSGLRQFHS
jgi:hypothetical protein